MKKTFTLFVGFLFALLTRAQPPEGNANAGDFYGDGASASGAIPAADLPAKLRSDTPIHVKVKARVLDVCPKKGCWLKIQLNDSATAFVKMKDYAFFVPIAVKGKYILLDGTAVVKTTSVAELRHYAEDAKKPKKEIEAISRPLEEIHFIAKGISVTQ